MNRKASRIVLAALLGAGIAAVFALRTRIDPAAMAQWVDGFGLAGPVVFMALYTIGTVLFLPGSMLTLAGGALFGPLWGTLYNLTGATLGATLAFLIARYLAADWVKRHSGGRLGRLQQGVTAEGWRFVAFVRLVPLFPFNALNYALGLTHIRLWHYVLTSYFCMLPGAMAYTYLGYAGREAVAGGGALVQKGLLALALLATAVFLPRLVTRLRHGTPLSAEELQRWLATSEAPLLIDLRPADDFHGTQGHIAGAISIPLETLAQRLDEIGRERPIALVCHTNRRAALAARLLARHGYHDIRVVNNGMTAWNTLGYPVEKG